MKVFPGTRCVRSFFSGSAGILYLKELRQLVMLAGVFPAAALMLAGAAWPYWFSLPDIRTYYSGFPFLMALFMPLLTMNSWAWEYRSGTRVILLSLPVPERTLVLAKFCALCTCWLAILIVSLPVPLLLSLHADGASSQIVPSLAALALYGISALAIGQLASNLMRSPVPAFLTTSIILLTVNNLHRLPGMLPIDPRITGWLTRMSFVWRFDNLNKGILDSRDLLFFILPVLGALYLDRMLLKRRRHQ